jgi:hypothetical protein
MEAQRSTKIRLNSLKFVKIHTEECFDKVLYHVNLQILKCKMKNVIIMEGVQPHAKKFTPSEEAMMPYKLFTPIH